MEVKVKYEKTKHLIDSTSVGEITTESVKEMFKMTLEVSDKYNCNNLLLDMTACWATQPIFKAYDLGTKLTINTGLTSQHRCALLYDSALYPTERANFIENVINNRPNPIFKIFEDQKEGRKWMSQLNI